jgi:transcriptional regulator with XRE-family HTH domain
MQIGDHLMAWRRQRGLTQFELAQRAHLSRPYVSNLEKGKVDPTLSSLRRLAGALDVPLAQLIEGAPPAKTLGRQQMDRLARGALHPGTPAVRHLPEVRVLARLLHDRRKALGLYTPKRRSLAGMARPRSSAIHAARWLRAALGDVQWKALLRRIDKLAAGGA